METDLRSKAIDSPAISVVMAVYNAESYLAEAVKSILSQSFTDFEFIVIDDGSTDGSLSILQSFSDTRLRIISNPNNHGIVYSVNLGIREARAELIARFDADDISLPYRLEQQFEYMKLHPDVAMVTSRIRLMDKYGNPDGFWPEDVAADTPEKIRAILPYTNCIAQPAVMIRTAVIRKFLYREDFWLSEDWGLWLELIAEGYVIGKINVPLVNYRIHPSSFTQKANAPGPYGKILKFQLSYLRSRIRRNKMKATDIRVAIAWLTGLLKFPYRRYVHPFLSKVKLAIDRKPWNFFALYFSIPDLLKNVKVVLFFPYYHTGGAERVHLSIVEALKDSNPVVFFTSKSKDDIFLTDFRNAARCCSIYDFTHFPFLSGWLLKKIAKCLNQQKQVSVFGSNSDFLYRLLPLLNKSVYKVDLLHAFVHEYETGPEKWSLPVVHLLDQRVFVSNQALQQMKEYYRKYNIPEKEAEKLRFIRNFTEIPDLEPVKSFPDPLEVIYIGRAGKEKRIPLILDAVRNYRNDKQVHFTLIGDVETLVSPDLLPYVALPGMLDAKQMRQYLEAAHVLVLTSSREGMPMVIFEAMAHGVVPVSTAVGDVPDYVQDDETGYLLPVHPDYAVVEALIYRIELLKKNPTLLQRISHNGFHLAAKQFSKSEFVANYRQLLLQNSSI